MNTLIYRGSYGWVTFEEETGRILSSRGYPDVYKVDVSSLSYDLLEDREADILEMSYWTFAGQYSHGAVWDEKARCHIWLCLGCGREEGVCSLEPCDEVVADRLDETPAERDMRLELQLPPEVAEDEV